MSKTRNLEVTTPSDREITVTRELNAPRHLVFDAFTKPEILKRWLFGPDGWTMTHCEWNLFVRGTYRYEWSGPNGETMGLGGVCKEVVAPERIVATEKFDGDWYPEESLVTITFTEENGRTRVATNILYANTETRDGMLKSGMDSGMEAGYKRLDAMFEETPV